MLIFGTGVQAAYFGDELCDIVSRASIASLCEGFDVYVVSIQDKTHGAGSLHPFGLAVDLGVAGNDAAKLERLFSRMTRVIPTTYDVIYEGDHVHVEYDLHRAIKDATAPGAV